MWTRESIKEMRAKFESEFSMSEQQIYKWWWDQTRKRVKRHNDNENDSHFSDQEEMEDGFQMITFQDEFGGYSSRLRHSNKKRVVEKENDGLEINLCEMLGIDIEAIAKRIAMGIDDDFHSNDD
jgi:hypothetical protein